MDMCVVGTFVDLWVCRPVKLGLLVCGPVSVQWVGLFVGLQWGGAFVGLHVCGICGSAVVCHYVHQSV